MTEKAEKKKNIMLRYIRRNVSYRDIFMMAAVVIAVAIYSIIKDYKLNSNPSYIKGVSLGLEPGVHGTYRLHYTFEVDGKSYEGSKEKSFCEKCPTCCMKGDTVLVKFENSNPQNNDLILNLPAHPLLY